MDVSNFGYGASHSVTKPARVAVFGGFPIMKKENYLCDSWQGWVQQILNLLTHGYYYYYLTQLPDHKKAKWLVIDKRLIKLYPIDFSKDKKYYQHKRKKANYAYLRWQKHVVILHTEGAVADYAGHKFIDFRVKPLIVPIGDERGLTLKIGKSSDGFTIYLSRVSFNEVKFNIIESIKNHNTKDVEYRFNSLNYLPGYTGIYKQRKSLLNTVKEHYKRNNIKFDRKDFKLAAYRRSVKVFVK